MIILAPYFFSEFYGFLRAAISTSIESLL